MHNLQIILFILSDSTNLLISIDLFGNIKCIFTYMKKNKENS